MTPAEVLARFRAGWFNNSKHAGGAGAAASGATVSSTADGAIEKTAPADLLAQLRALGGKSQITPIKYVEAENGKIVRVVDNGAPLPADAELAVVSQTTTGLVLEQQTVFLKVIVGERTAGRGTRTPARRPAPGVKPNK